MKRIEYLEFKQKTEAAYERHRVAVEEASRKLRYEIDMIEINYNGPNWLKTGKVGGWDE